MASAKLGTVTCPFCGTGGCAVRENKAGRLFYQCPQCYQVQPHGPGFQDFMMARAELAAATPPPPEKPKPKPKRARKPAPVAETADQAGEGGGFRDFLGGLLKDDDE